VQVLIPALTITKTAGTTRTVPGGTVGYTITVSNTGQTSYTGISVTDPLSGVLGDAVYNGDATATAGTVSFSSPVLTWNGDVAVGATVTITYSVTVKNPDPGGKVLANTVTSTANGSTCSAAGGNAACTTTVGVLTPALTLTKTADTATTAPGATVHYTVKVTNTGQTSYPAANFTDALTRVLDDATYNGDATATSGTVSYASPDLTWTGALAPGATATITYSATVKSPDPGDKTLTNTLSSTSTGSDCPAGGADPRCTTTVAASALLITSATDVTTTIPTGVVQYTFTVTNTGQTPYSDADFTLVLADVVDNATYNNDATATSGNLSVNPDGSVTWTGDLAIGATATVTASVTVNNPPTGGPTMTSSITSTTPGNNCPVGGSDPACSTTVTILIPQLAIAKTADTSTATPGQTITYTITVANTGPTPYTAATVQDALDGVLADADYNDDATATSGALSYTSPDLTWTGDLAIGATATITYTVTVKNPDPGDKHLSNTVTSTALGNNCATTSTDPACTAHVTVLVPQLTITKTAGTPEVVAGGTVHYTITVANTGQTPYTGATLTDPLTGVLDDATYNNDAAATSGTASYAAPALTWTGNLIEGATATITYTVTTANPGTGDHTLTNTAVSSATGSNCPGGGTDARCTATTPVTAQSIVLSDLTSAFTLTGGPNTTTARDAAVTMTVVTNSPTGYNVTVRAAAPALTRPGTAATIPVTALHVRETGTTVFQPLSATGPVITHTQTIPSAQNGDPLSNDYEADIPFVPSGRYTGTLDYIAATQ
jgi:uncharacterized repeat protein (TIGR01451 family)/fimbrial isopeptide formation D2 family protein